jgi:hypothetical protein
MNYTPELLSLFQFLELERIAELKKFGSIAIVVIAIVLFVFLKFRSNLLISLAFGFIILVVSHYIVTTNYTKKIQSVLMPKIIKSIDSDFKYLKDSSIELNTINSWKLFSHELDASYSSGSVVSKDVSFSFLELESSTIDTEEGRHERKRFDGIIIELKDQKPFDQRYLISAKKIATDSFEAGDFINKSHMGLKLVQELPNDLALFSQDGKSMIDNSLLEKLQKFQNNIKKEIVAICENSKVYILVDGINDNYTASLFKPLQKQGIVQGYAMLIGDIKEL